MTATTPYQGQGRSGTFLTKHMLMKGASK